MGERQQQRMLDRVSETTAVPPEVVLTGPMSVRIALLTIIALVSVVFINGWRQSGLTGSAAVDDRRRQPSPLQLAIGFVTNFFDTLGIGPVCDNHRQLQAAARGARRTHRGSASSSVTHCPLSSKRSFFSSQCRSIRQCSRP